MFFPFNKFQCSGWPIEPQNGYSYQKWKKEIEKEDENPFERQSKKKERRSRQLNLHSNQINVKKWNSNWYWIRSILFFPFFYETSYSFSSVIVMPFLFIWWDEKRMKKKKNKSLTKTPFGWNEFRIFFYFVESDFKCFEMELKSSRNSNLFKIKKKKKFIDRKLAKSIDLSYDSKRVSVALFVFLFFSGICNAMQCNVHQQLLPTVLLKWRKRRKGKGKVEVKVRTNMLFTLHSKRKKIEIEKSAFSLNFFFRSSAQFKLSTKLHHVVTVIIAQGHRIQFLILSLKGSDENCSEAIQINSTTISSEMIIAQLTEKF